MVAECLENGLLGYVPLEVSGHRDVSKVDECFVFGTDTGVPYVWYYQVLASPR